MIRAWLHENRYYLLAFLFSLALFISDLPLFVHIFIAAAAIFLSFLNPNFGISTVLFSVVFQRTLQITTLPVNTVNYFFACLVSGFLLRVILKRQQIQLDRSTAIASFFLLLLPSILFLKQGLFDVDSIRAILRVAELIVFVAISSQVITSEKTLKSHFASLVVMALIASFYGVYQWFFDVSSDFLVQGNLRVYSFFAHPNLFAGFLAMILPIPLIGIFFQRKKAERILCALIFIILFLNLVFTFSRASLFSFFIVAILLLIISVRFKQVKITYALIVLFLLLIIPPLIFFVTTNRFSEIPLYFNDKEQAFNINQRILCWETAFNVIQAHFWSGAGPRNWHTYSQEYAPTGTHAICLDHHPHNLYLYLWVTFGFVVLMLFLLYVGIILRKNIQLLRIRKDNLLLLALMGSFAFLISSLFDVLIYRRLELIFAFYLAIPLIFEKCHTSSLGGG
jgi:O-antigen ligase